MRLGGALLACMACSSPRSGKDGSPAVQDVVLTGAPTDLVEWEAWTLDTESGVLAAAPAFGRKGVTIDLASGVVRQSGEATLFDSDKPLWFDHGSGMCSDGVATLVSCTSETGFHRDAASLVRLAPGAIAMLARGGDGHVRLTAWSGTDEAWRYAPEPAADAGGVAVAADGLSLAIVESRDEGPTSVAMLDPATGAVRWSVEAKLRLRTWPALFQPVAFVDSDRKLLVAGEGSSGAAMVVLDAKDGATVDTFTVVDGASPSDDNLHTWFGVSHDAVWVLEVHHVRRPSHPLWGDVQEHWECAYRAYHKGKLRAVVDTERNEAISKQLFGEDRRDCDVRVARPLRDGGLVTVSLTSSGLRVRRWRVPPGLR